MSLFSQKTKWVFSFLGILLLFLPKINLLSVKGQTAGLRIDDILLFFIGTVIFWAHFLLNKRMNRFEKLMVSLLLLSFISFFFNRVFISLGWIFVEAKFLYCLRFFEYFLFFYVGAFSISFFSAERVAALLFLFNGLAIIAQKLTLMGGFTIDGYISNVSYRTPGLSSFPSEMGAVLSILFSYLIFSRKKFLPNIFAQPHIKAFLYNILLICFFTLTALLTLFTGARIAIASLLFSFAGKIKEEFYSQGRRNPLAPLIVFGVIACFSYAVASKIYVLLERSADLFSLANIDLIEKVWARIDINEIPIGNETLSSKGYDMSWWMRIHKWCYALKIYLLHPECYLQGIGPGFAMSALDGGLLRILVEYGLIGVYLFGWLFKEMAGLSTALFWVVAALLINMIFFDAYLAYKPMSLVFFLVGYTYYSKKKTAIQESH